jgi:MoxR-like ATPase
MQQTPTYEAVFACSLADPATCFVTVSEPPDAALAKFVPARARCHLVFADAVGRTARARLAVNEPGSKVGMYFLLIDLQKKLADLRIAVDEVEFEKIVRELVLKVPEKFQRNVDYLAFLCEYAVPQLSATKENKEAVWRGRLFSLAEKLLIDKDDWPNPVLKGKPHQIVGLQSLLELLIGAQYISKKRSVSGIPSKVSSVTQEITNNLPPKLPFENLSQVQQPKVKTVNPLLKLPLKNEGLSKKPSNKEIAPSRSTRPDQSHQNQNSRARPQFKDDKIDQILDEQLLPSQLSPITQKPIKPQASVEGGELQGMRYPTPGTGARPLPADNRAESKVGPAEPNNNTLQNRGLQFKNTFESRDRHEQNVIAQRQIQPADDVSVNPYLNKIPQQLPIRSNEIKEQDSFLMSFYVAENPAGLLMQTRHEEYPKEIQNEERDSFFASDDEGPFKTNRSHQEFISSPTRVKNFPSSKHEELHNLTLQIINTNKEEFQQLNQLSPAFFSLLFLVRSGLPNIVNFQSSLLLSLLLPGVPPPGLEKRVADTITEQSLEKCDSFWRHLACKLVHSSDDFLQTLHESAAARNSHQTFLVDARQLLAQAHEQLTSPEAIFDSCLSLLAASARYRGLYAGNHGQQLGSLLSASLESLPTDQQADLFFALIAQAASAPDALAPVAIQFGPRLAATCPERVLAGLAHADWAEPVAAGLLDAHCPAPVESRPRPLFAKLLAETRRPSADRPLSALVGCLALNKPGFGPRMRDAARALRVAVKVFLDEFRVGSLPADLFANAKSEDVYAVLMVMLAFETHSTEDVTENVSMNLEALPKLKTAEKIINFAHEVCNTLVIKFANQRLANKVTAALKNPIVKNISELFFDSDWGKSSGHGFLYSSPFLRKIVCYSIKKTVLPKKLLDSLSLTEIGTASDKIINELSTIFDGFTGIPAEYLISLDEQIGASEEMFQEQFLSLYDNNAGKVKLYWKVYLINLFIFKKDSLETTMSKLGRILSQANIIESANRYRLSELRSTYRELPKLGVVITPEDETTLTTLLTYAPAESLLVDLFTFALKFTDPQAKEPLHQMVVDGEAVNFNVTFEDFRFAKTFLNVFEKTSKEPSVKSADQFLELLIKRLCHQFQLDNIKNILVELSAIFTRIETCYEQYIKAPGSEKNLLRKVLDESKVFFELRTDLDGFDYKIELKQMTLNSDKLEELKIKLIVGGNSIGEENDDSIKTQFLDLLESIGSIKKSLLAVYQQGDIIDLGRALLAHVDESLRPAFINEAKISLIRVEVHCRASLSAHPAAALRLVDRGMLAVVELLQDSSTKRNNNQARLRLYLTSKQKQLLCQGLLDKKIRKLNEFDPIPGILRYSTGFRKQAIFSEVERVANEFSKGEQIYSTGLFESLSTLLFFDDKKHTDYLLRGRVSYSIYEKSIMETILIHLAKFNTTEKNLANKVMICNQRTDSIDIETFIERAMTDKSHAWYYLLDFHLLKSATLKAAINHLKFMFSDTRHYSSDRLLCLASAEGLPAGPLHPSGHPDVFEFVETQTLGESKLAGLESRRFDELKASLKTCVVTAPLSGLGKSTFVARACEQKGWARVTLLLAGEAGSQALEQRLAIVASFIRDNPATKFALHLKIDSEEGAQGQAERLNQFLLGVCLLGTVPFGGGHLFLDGLEAVYVEVASNCGNLLTSLSEARLCPTHSCRAFSFADLDCSLLQAGSLRLLDVFVGYWLALKTTDNGKSHLEQYNLVDENGEFITTDFEEGFFEDKLRLRNCIKEVIESMSRLRSINVVPSQITYSQLVSYVEVVAHQLLELDKIGALIPSKKFSINQSAKMKARLILFRMIYESAFVSTFAMAQSLRDESKDTRLLINKLKAAEPTGHKKMIADFQNKVESIPSWEESISKGQNLFIRNGSLKILIKDESKLDLNLKVIHNLGKLQDYSNLRKRDEADEYLQNLIEGLDLEVILTKKQDADYIKFKTDPEKQKEKSNYLLAFMKEQARKFKDKGFVVTRDNYLKLMMLVQRADYSVPVILMGATGCGKTFLVHFAAACLLRDQFCLVALHPGKSEKDLVDEINQAVDKAEACRQVNHARVWVLFDEFNTSALQPLIAEVMLERRSSFSRLLKPIPPNIVFLAACNPFKIYGNSSTEGLVNEVTNTVLAHRVHPIPDCLMSLIWDFGQLEGSTEEAYIHSMISLQTKTNYLEFEEQDIAKVIIICQKFIREKEGKSSVSLRDVSRFLAIMTYCKPRFPDFNTSLAVAAAVSYFLRIDDLEKRKTLDSLLLKAVPVSLWQVFEKVSDQFAQAVADQGFVPEDIALNRPLKENLFSLVLTQAIKLPIIICGKPGTSKTLSTTICQAIFKAKQEIKARLPFFSYLQNLLVVNFSGTQSTTCQAIENCYKKAENLANKLGNSVNSRDRSSIVSVFFDEIGLAEIADENPLKVLHQKLEPDVPTVGFVGISNWRLDLSKMNRVIYVSRPDPGLDDLALPFKARLEQTGDPFLRKAVDCLVETYHDLRQAEETGLPSHPNFHGARDFYNAARQLLEARDKLQHPDSPASFTLAAELAVKRNFGGVHLDQTPTAAFFWDRLKRRLGGDLGEQKLGPLDPVFHNLADPDSRHLMLFCENAQVEEIVVEEVRAFSCKVLGKPESMVKSFVACRSKAEELEILNSLSVMVYQGYTVVLKRLDAVYGCLYELFNQRYEERRGVKGCYLVYDSHRQWIPVHRDFKAIVLMDDLAGRGTDADLEKRQQPPFLNRFEKQLILQRHLLDNLQADLLAKVQRRYLEEPTKLPNILIHNLSRDMLLALVMNFTKASFFDSIEIQNCPDKYKAYLNHTQNSREPSITKSKETMEIGKSYLPNSFLQNSSNFGNNFDLIDKEIIQFYSRNMIIEYYLTIGKNLTEKDRYQAFKEEFLASHKYDSIRELIDEASSPFVSDLCNMVFTFSDSFCLGSILSNYKNLYLIKANELIAAKKSDMLKTTEVIMKDTSTAVAIIQFSSSSEWNILREIQRELLEKSQKYSKPCIAIIHVEFGLNPKDCFTGVHISEIGWKFHTIDNLEGCQYELFFDRLNMTTADYISSMIDQSMDRPQTSFLYRKLRETAVDLITASQLAKCRSAGEVLDQSKSAAALFTDSRAFSAILKLAVTPQSQSHDRSPSISELLAIDAGHRAGLHGDGERYVAALAAETCAPSLARLVNMLEAAKCFVFLARAACVADEHERKAIIERRWLPVARGLAQSDHDGQADPGQVEHGFYARVVDGFEGKLAVRLVLKWAAQVREVIDEARRDVDDEQINYQRRKSAQIKNLVLTLCKTGVSEDQKEDILPFLDFDAVPITSIDEFVLVSIYIIENLNQTTNGPNLSYLTSKILMKLGFIFMKPSNGSSNSPYISLVEGILIMMLINEIYKEEIENVFALLQSSDNSETLMEDLIEEFKEDFFFNIHSSRLEVPSFQSAFSDISSLKTYVTAVRKYIQSAASQNTSPLDQQLHEAQGLFASTLLSALPASPHLLPAARRLLSTAASEPSRPSQAGLAQLARLLASPDLRGLLLPRSLSLLVAAIACSTPLGTAVCADVAAFVCHAEPAALACAWPTDGCPATLATALATADNGARVALLRAAEFAKRKVGRCLDSSQPPMKVLTCKPEDFSIHTSIRMKLYLEHSLQHPETMNAVLKTLETEINKKVDDEKVLHVLRFLFKTNNQDKLNDNCLQVLKMDRSLLARNSGENESSITEALFLFGKSEAKEIKDAITELNAKNSKVKNCEKNLEFWLKYLILLSDVNKVDQTIEFINNRDTFLSFTKSQANRYISELLPSSKNPEDSLSYVSLGLVMIALESLKFELGGPNIHREMIDEIDNLRQLRSKIEGTSFELDYLDLLVNILDYIQHQTFAALDAYRAKTRKTRLLHEPVGRWAFVLWLSALAKLAAKKHMMLTELVLAANADTANKVNKTAFDEYKTIHEELTSQLQPPCSKILEFCKADEVDTTYYGKVLGPAHCNFSKFLTTKYDIDFDSIMESLLGQKIEIGPVIEHCFNEYETIILCDSILLTIAEFVTNLKQVVTSLESPNLAQLVESDLQTLLKYNPHPGLQAAHEKLLDHFSQVAPDLERICLEKNKEILANQVAFKKFLADRNPKLGSLIFGSPFGLCILEEISKSMMELRNHLFDSTINALENSEFVYTKTVSVIDMKPTDTMEHLQEQEPDSQSQSRNRRSNPIRKFLITHFQVDLAGTVHFDEAIVAQAFYRQVIGRLGKLVVKPLLRVARDDRNMGTADLDLDGLVRAALAKVTQDKDVVEATSKHQREVVRMFETAKTLPQQDKIAFNLKMMTTQCAKVILDSDDVKPSTKLTVLVPEILGGIASLKEFYDSVPTLHLSFLRKVQLALSFREYKAFLDKGCLGEIYERLQAVIKENKVIKESLTFFAIEVSCQVARLMEAEPEERKKHAESSFDSLPLESETKQRLHSWLERVGGSKEFKLTDAVWIVAAMEKVRDLL